MLIKKLIKKIFKALTFYFIFSAFVYFASYGILVLEHRNLVVQTEDEFLNKMVINATKEMLLFAMKDLKGRSYFFFIYWPRALQYALKFILV